METVRQVFTEGISRGMSSFGESGGEDLSELMCPWECVRGNVMEYVWEMSTFSGSGMGNSWENLLGRQCPLYLTAEGRNWKMSPFAKRGRKTSGSGRGLSRWWNVSGKCLLFWKWKMERPRNSGGRCPGEYFQEKNILQQKGEMRVCALSMKVGRENPWAICPGIYLEHEQSRTVGGGVEIVPGRVELRGTEWATFAAAGGWRVWPSVGGGRQCLSSPDLMSLAARPIHCRDITHHPVHLASA